MKSKEKIRWFSFLMQKYTFLTVFLLLFACYLPYFISSYPAILTGDTIEQVQQGFSVSSYYPYVVRTYEDSKLVNHHPVVHTLLLKVCLQLGRNVFNSWNTGIFIYSVIQVLFSLMVYSYAFCVVYRKTNLDRKCSLITLLYFIVHPRIQAFLMVVTKDIFYSSFLLLAIVTAFEILKGDKRKKKKVIFTIALILIVIFRNEGIYVLLPFIFCLSINKKIRRFSIVLFSFVLMFWVGWNHAVLPAMHVNKGSTREMLSIPFQQTARYIKEYHREVTDDEREAISKVLLYHSLAQRYNQNISDDVKGTFNEEATKEDLKKYFKVWLQMGLKHPDVYFSATISNKSQFFCPDLALGNYYTYEFSSKVMGMVNDACNELNMSLEYPEKLCEFRNIYEKIREGFFSMPIIAVLRCSCLYIWVLLYWSFFCIVSKKIKAFTLTVPLLVQILVLIAGPTNGYYFRYMTPFAVSIPFVLLLGYDLIKNDINNKE